MVRPNISDEMEEEVDRLARELTKDKYVPVDRLGFEPKLKLILDYSTNNRRLRKASVMFAEEDDEDDE
jgi:hypothetical protein